MDIVEQVQKIGDGIFETIKLGLKVDFNIILDDDAESEWNEFWDSFVLGRLADDGWEIE